MVEPIGFSGSFVAAGLETGVSLGLSVGGSLLVGAPFASKRACLIASGIGGMVPFLAKTTQDYLKGGEKRREECVINMFEVGAGLTLSLLPAVPLLLLAAHFAVSLFTEFYRQKLVWNRNDEAIGSSLIAAASSGLIGGLFLIPQACRRYSIQKPSGENPVFQQYSPVHWRELCFLTREIFPNLRPGVIGYLLHIYKENIQIVFAKKRIVGFSLFTPDPGPNKRAEVIWLESIGVKRDFRGRGILRGLLERFEGEAKARGAQRVELAVEKGNQAAIRCYEGSGYRRVPREEDLTGLKWTYGKDL